MAVELAPWAGILDGEDGEELAHVGTEHPREARTAPFPDALHPKVRGALEARGVTELYAHQRAAWDAAARGEHVGVVTGTASGKTLAFDLPVLDALAARAARAGALPLADEGARAGPGARRSTEPAGAARCGRRSTTATPPGRARAGGSAGARTCCSRTRTCSTSAFSRTTTAGATCSRTSRYVVVDEAHVYRGVFGSHVAQRAPPAAPARAGLRRRPAVPARLGDDREPRRAGAAADRVDP